MNATDPTGPTGPTGPTDPTDPTDTEPAGRTDVAGHPDRVHRMAPMYGSGQAHRRVARMREEARRLEAAAERAADPQERRRLEQEAGRLESDCEQESMMAAGDIYPTE